MTQPTAPERVAGLTVNETALAYYAEFMRNVDRALEEKLADHLRSQGWTIEPPASTPLEA